MKEPEYMTIGEIRGRMSRDDDFDFKTVLPVSRYEDGDTTFLEFTGRLSKRGYKKRKNSKRLVYKWHLGMFAKTYISASAVTATWQLQSYHTNELETTIYIKAIYQDGLIAVIEGSDIAAEFLLGGKSVAFRRADETGLLFSAMSIKEAHDRWEDEQTEIKRQEIAEMLL